MKKSVILISLLVSIMSLATYKKNVALKEIPQNIKNTRENSIQLENLKNEQKYQNCLKYIENSSFESWKTINIDIVESQKINETVKEYVSIEKGKELLLDSSDLIYTIGDTYAHNFANIVCDNETNEVIGYIPVD